MLLDFSLRRRIYSLCTLGLLALLAMRSSFFVDAFKSAKLFKPLVEKFPEAQHALQNDARMNSMVQKLIDTYNPLPHLEKSDKLGQLANFHIPVYLYVDALLQRHRTKDSTKPMFIGVSAPQGCGKTTLTNIVCDLFRMEGKTCITMSLDDFYLTGQQQEQLFSMHKYNPLLEFRGNAGTHDLHLAMTTLHSLQTLRKPAARADSSAATGTVTTAPVKTTAAGSSSSSNGKKAPPQASPPQVALIPRYDKALRQGRGDRLDRSAWTTIAEPVDVVLFEGWMLGFNPLPHISLPVYSNRTAAALDNAVGMAADGTVTGAADHTAVSTQEAQAAAAEQERELAEFNEAFAKARNIKEVNELLRPYEALHLLMDAWLVLAVQDPAVVHKWRLQAEHQMLLQGRGGMTDEQVAEFVARFMPAYQTYLPELYSSGPQRSSARPELTVPAPAAVQAAAAAAAAFGGSIGADGGGGSLLAPVLKVTVNEDRLPASVEVM